MPGLRQIALNIQITKHKQIRNLGRGLERAIKFFADSVNVALRMRGVYYTSSSYECIIMGQTLAPVLRDILHFICGYVHLSEVNIPFNI